MLGLGIKFLQLNKVISVGPRTGRKTQMGKFNVTLLCLESAPVLFVLVFGEQRHKRRMAGESF
jgi:hypothetical protein